jgi:hypothetical protein
MSAFPKTWDEDVVTDYIKQESQQKSPDVFLETHIPINKIRAETLIGYDGDFVSEEGLFEHISQSSPKDEENRIYLLKGEVGSGKSHLCQWLEYQINGYGDLAGAEDHVAIHISRNSTRLSDILEKLYEHIDTEHDELDDIVELNPDDLADFIISGLNTFGANTESFSGFDLSEFIADNQNKLDLRSVLQENIREYQEAVEEEEREQRIELITREEFGRICFNVFGESFKDSEVYPTVRNAIHDRLMKNLGIEDFQAELIKVSDQYQKEGKRPVLIAEDVTTFTVLKDDLLDHIFQLGDGGGEMESGFDVVLGYTTGWESEKADDALMTGDLSYMRQRAEGYLQMTNEDGQAYFLENGAMPVQLVQKYLDVIKEHSDVSVGDSINEVEFEELYPFNKRFVMRAYSHLEEEGTLQQTPRLLLYHVIGDCLLSGIPPHEKIEGNTYIREFSAPTSAESQSPSFRQLVKWYGRMEDGQVVVPVAYFETFDVDIPEETSIKNDLVVLNVLYENVGWEIPESDLRPVDVDNPGQQFKSGDENETPETEVESDGDDQKTESTVTDPGTEQKSDIDKEAQSQRAKRIEQFRSWYGGGGDFPSSNQLKEGVVAALNRFYDPTRLANEKATTTGTAGFYYASGDHVPVEIRGPDATKDVAVTVTHVTEGDADYERLLYEMMLYGLEDEFRDEANFDAIRSWCDNQVFALRSTMREDLEDALADDMTLEEFLVLARFLLLNAAHGVEEIDRAQLLRDPDEYKLDSVSPFKVDKDEAPFELPSSLEDGFSQLTTRRSDIGNLCQGFFLLKSNFVDHERLEPAVKNVSENFEDYLDAAARISSSEVADGYRVGTTRSNATARVEKLFETVSNYANELQKLQQSFDIEVIHEDIQVVKELYSRSYTADDLLDIFNRLEASIQPLDVNFQVRWENAKTILKDGSEELGLRDFGDALATFEEADPDTGLEVMSLMYEYHRSRNKQKAWLVYEVLGEMIAAIEDHPEAGADEFRNLIRQSDEFQKFQNKRDIVSKTMGGI